MYTLLLQMTIIQFNSKRAAMKCSQELKNSSMLGYVEWCTPKFTLFAHVHRIFLYFSVRHRAKRAQDSCQALPSTSPPSWTAWLLDNHGVH